MDNRKYPIGPFVIQETYSPGELAQIIHRIETIPAEYRRLVENLSPDDLAKTYREGSWTVRQLVHHVADIQLLHYLRMKKALTEPDYSEATMIDMNAWAGTADATTAPVDDSLLLFEGAHRRYAYLARSLDEKALAIRYNHPVRKIQFTQAQALAISVWHAEHHLAHIKLALSTI
ncbi:putative metal-dependent hydrolase [Spirosoma aureum]|uniref:Putative metal-dependent hydrolase n=1 Tax=Spirosoma aureum TaxID=2692134 RepID=A0A6G9AXA3_9BACT|nr:putative metal-dependent hydrolase [Spirosoma aureum]QIP17092.1 putative metal-dependent hydrolase [Spirosoma aureum]